MMLNFWISFVLFFVTSLYFHTFTSAESSHPTIKPKQPSAVPSSSSKPSIKPKNPTIIPILLSDISIPTSARPTIRPKSPTRLPSRSIRPSIRPKFPTKRPISVKPSFVPSNRKVPTSSPSIASSSSRTTSPSVSSSPTVNPSSSPTTSLSVVPSISPTYTPFTLTSNPSISNQNITEIDVWSSNGGNLADSRSVTNSLITSSSFSLAAKTHFFDVGSSVYTTPAIFDNLVIFPSHDGNVYAFDKYTKLQVWKKNIHIDYYGRTQNKYVNSRTTPARYGSSFLIGITVPGDILKIDIATGTLLGSIRLDTHPDCRITTSGTVFGDQFLVGTSSEEERATINPGYQCCTFGGSFQSIHIPSMTVTWVWHAIPPAQLGVGKLSGNAIWGSSPAVDAISGIVYFATGNNYGIPADLDACYGSTSNDEVQCNLRLYPDNYYDSVVALDVYTGTKVWARRFWGFDSWNNACNLQNSDPRSKNCARNNGPDYDFGMCPSLSTYGTNGKAVYISNKSGITYCLNATTGLTIWEVQSSPPGGIGGHSWGISVDDTRVYVSIINNGRGFWTLKNGTVIRGGGWAAIDKVSGVILWTVANPAYFDTGANGRSSLSWATGPAAAVGDIILVGSCDGVQSPVGSIATYGSGGYAYALRKSDGKIMSSFETGASIYGAFSVDTHCAFVGHGYSSFKMTPGKGVTGWCI